MLGWVYVMGTAQAGTYKIGFTRRTPKERAAELARDARYGRFGPFTVELALPCSWPDRVEQNIHRMLQDREVLGEVFRVDLETAKSIVRAASMPGPRPYSRGEPLRAANVSPEALRRQIQRGKATRQHMKVVRRARGWLERKLYPVVFAGSAAGVIVWFFG